MRNITISILSMILILTGCASKKGKPGSPLSKENVPSLTAPEVRRIWVNERIEGTRFIDGHYEYIIDKPSVWSK